MPSRDGTGPEGNGPKTGRGLGKCTGASASFGRNRGFGRGFRCRRWGNYSKDEEKTFLEAEKKEINKRLEELNKE